MDNNTSSGEMRIESKHYKETKIAKLLLKSKYKKLKHKKKKCLGPKTLRLQVNSMDGVNGQSISIIIDKHSKNHEFVSV